MPLILTDEKIKEDCFNTRFPINALSVLKVKTLVNKDNVVIQSPAVLPISYPSSINSLSKGLASTLDMPQQQVRLFLEKEVRAVVVDDVQVEKEKVADLVAELPDELEYVSITDVKTMRKPRSDAGVKRGRNAAGRRKAEKSERAAMAQEDYVVPDGETAEIPEENLRGGEL